MVRRRFLSEYDYRTLIRERVQNMVNDYRDIHRIRAEDYAMEEISGYLNFCYDTDAMFDFHFENMDLSNGHQAGTWTIDPLDGTVRYCKTSATTTLPQPISDFVELGAGIAHSSYGETATYNEGDTVIGLSGEKYLVIGNPLVGVPLSDGNHFILTRNDFLVMLMADISIYHYHSRIEHNQIPQLRIDRYLDAVSKLEKMRRKILSPSFPRTDMDGDGQPDTGVLAMYSNVKRDNCW